MNEQPSVPFVELWERLQDHPTSQYIGFTGWFPFLESMHVLAIGLVVGTILMVDLRLLGVSALSYPVSRMVRELTPWTWGAVVVAMVTGVGMFVTRAPAYVENPAFQLKLVFLLLAFVNMTFFQFRTYRRVQAWDSHGAHAASGQGRRRRVSSPLGRHHRGRPLDRTHHLNRITARRHPAPPLALRPGYR